MSEYEKLADLFKVFSDPTRIRILNCLENGEKSVGDIAEELSMTQSAISHQLNTLKMNKLVKTRRNGKLCMYSLDDEHVEAIMSCGMDHICEV